MTNPIASKVVPGISSWRKIARVKLLDSGQGRTLSERQLFIPRIVYGNWKNAILICTGLHLEETSGPLTFLNPKRIKILLKLAKKKKLSLIIYPVVNNFGLIYKPTEDERFLRRDENGINYNDGWGGAKKAKEVEIVEADILSLMKSHKIMLCLSLHEDSLSPKKGYLWINGITNSEKRKAIYKKVRKSINPKYLLKIKEKKILGGRVEDNLAIVDSSDPEAFEDWMANLGVGTVLSEAPFCSPLFARSKFHLEVIKASIMAAFKEPKVS